ncbi:hypothetical protein BC938DRAFT_471524 [Jimgerdemannia flammicorona]|uniref:Uncharacterized protein n=1 Tax=Jimgerdemannia flammicorona TaxID=994334 RepID=A0A433Q7Z9_9FUNG|nr:hypothetical protein BC938DRAFT_471524 [Jimgerdemannia flammicorona]
MHRGFSIDIRSTTKFVRSECYQRYDSRDLTTARQTLLSLGHEHCRSSQDHLDCFQHGCRCSGVRLLDKHIPLNPSLPPPPERNI